MRKTFTLFLFFTLIQLGRVYAQQDPMYSQYMFNTLAINPAYAGSREVLSITSLYRKQWVGIGGAPTSQTISMDMPFARKNMGMGFQLYNDKLGISRNTGAYASFAYRLRFPIGTLAFGMQVGVTQFQANYMSVVLDQYDRQADAAFDQNVLAFLPNVGTGVYYSTDKFYVGASLPHLLKNKLNRSGENLVIGNRASQYRHLFLSAGYVFTVSDKVKVKPSTQIKTVIGAPLQFDANLNTWFYDRFAVGVSYRTGDAMVGMTEIQLNDQFRLGYSYDWTTSKLTRYNSGSHEIMLRYELGFRRDRILSPRYF